MARPQPELQVLLRTLLGTNQVYFQQPGAEQMQYPCIIYSIDNTSEKYADNIHYHRDIRYMVTVIDRRPDSDIPKKIADLPYCSFNRFFTADNLNHFVYSLYF
jgi:hypothetical protein